MREFPPSRLLIVAAFAAWSLTARAHDFERTQVTLTFVRDGSFVLDVTNDAAWLEHRLIPFENSVFADRVVLFVDGREIRPESVTFIKGPAPLASYRLRGRMPLDAQTLRWYYGLPIDPYPLTIRRADGRIVVHEIAGDAWSPPIDISGQFQTARISATTVAVSIAALLVVPVVLRFRSALRR